jgi:acyl-CoA thioesterase-1
MTRMKKQILVSLFTGACLCMGGLPAFAVNIMPMGDSVTSRGDSPESSYRYWLYTDLVNAGVSFAFVGNQNGVSDGTPANSNFDQSYEGGGSLNDAWSTQDGIDNLGNATSQGADIVLLDLGSNDFNSGIDTKSNEAEVTANLETIIEGFAAVKPDIIILLAKPTHWVATGGPAEKKFMSGLGGAVSKAAKAEKKAGVNVVLVDLSSGFNARKDTKDGTHPNVQGEQKIANKYFKALKKVL